LSSSTSGALTPAAEATVWREVSAERRSRERQSVRAPSESSEGLARAAPGPIEHVRCIF
jgi:hypothetical protein